MIVWAVLAVSLFGVLPTRAEVVDDFINCSVFFYKGKQPQGFDQNAHKICQSYDSSYFFASLYSTTHRIPLYSAYTFDYGCLNQGGRKTGNWFIEPQLSKDEKPDYLTVVYMKKYNARDSPRLKVKQAVNDDYSHTGYDRGHLNPNSYQCGRGRDATFTLTNSAPMDACFNRVHWKEWEAAVKQMLRQQGSGGKAYLVTGTVPAASNRIPRQGIFDDPSERDYNRVTVPTHIWTAICYDHPNKEESFSFGYIGVNKPHGIIKVKSVQRLKDRLSVLYASNNLNIFTDDCSSPNSNKHKSEKMAKNLFNMVQLPMRNQLRMSPDDNKLFRTALSHSDDERRTYPTDTDTDTVERVEIKDIKVDFFYKFKKSWLTGMEDIKFASGLSCLLDSPFYGLVRDELRRKRQTSQELVCRLKPEVLDDCSTSCLYIDEAKDYRCSTGYETVRCSPTYSDITIGGERCSSDHTCGHHGWDYYWCNTASSWNYCSPPLPLGKTTKGLDCSSKRNCAYYGSRNLWCDIGDSWDYCTI